MNGKKLIPIGARVNVYFERTECLFYMTLIDAPSEGNEYFVVEGRDGILHYVTNFSRISEIDPNDYRNFIDREKT